MSLYVIPDEIDFSAYMQETAGGRKVRDVGDYLREMLDEIGKPQAAATGWALPWDKTRETFRYHPGEVTLWAGSNGTGKSLLTGQIALDMVCRREPVVIASRRSTPMFSVVKSCGVPAVIVTPASSVYSVLVHHGAK